MADMYFHRVKLIDYLKEKSLTKFNSFYKGYVEAIKDVIAFDSTEVQPVKRCKMIPLEPDCRNYTDVFICTNCHNHIHLGFIRKEYSGSYCLECGAEVMDGGIDG